MSKQDEDLLMKELEADAAQAACWYEQAPMTTCSLMTGSADCLCKSCPSCSKHNEEVALHAHVEPNELHQHVHADL